MKLELENGKSLDVKFWSFFKCYFLSYLTLSGILIVALAILGMLI